MRKGMEDFYREKYGLDKLMLLVHTFKEYAQPENHSGMEGIGKESYEAAPVIIGNNAIGGVPFKILKEL